jgi:ABC-type polysaccharide/polyol phosphate export permease
MNSADSTADRGFESGELHRLSYAALARRDLLNGLWKSWLWLALASQDIKLRYRGSVLGPFWITLSTIIMVAAMGLLYARLFNQPPETYLPFLSIGLVIWQFLSGVINEGCHTFLAAEGIIRQVPMPFSVHAYRVVCRNLFVLAHNLVIVPILIIIFSVPVGWSVFLVVPGFFILAINGLWIGLILGMVSARYRDIPGIVGSLLQVVFLATPIFWSPDMLGRWKEWGELNPFFAAIDVVRAPLLGVKTAPHSWEILLLVTILGSICSFGIFARLRARIAYWI